MQKRPQKKSPPKSPVLFQATEPGGPDGPPALNGAAPFQGQGASRLTQFPVEGFAPALGSALEKRIRRPKVVEAPKGYHADGTPRQRAVRGSLPVLAPVRLVALCVLPDDEKLRALLSTARPADLVALRARATALLAFVNARTAAIKREVAELFDMPDAPKSAPKDAPKDKKGGGKR